MTKTPRDISGDQLRRALKSHGFDGRYVPITIADLVTHPDRPDAFFSIAVAASNREKLRRALEWKDSSNRPDITDDPAKLLELAQSFLEDGALGSALSFNARAGVAIQAQLRRQMQMLENAEQGERTAHA